MKSNISRHKPFFTQWAEFFEKKLKDDFKIDTSLMTNYQLDAAPLIYCCLLHRLVPVKKWNVIESKEFQKSSWIKAKEWLNIKNKLEDGLDINSYMSKSIKEWSKIDYLLYTYRIHHFHIYKDKNGGIRNELVYGVFHKNNFYVLDIKGHNELYYPDKWIKIIKSNWPSISILPNVSNTIKGIYMPFDSKAFKNYANNPKFQFNNINPIQVKLESGEFISLSSQQHTTLINFRLNNILYKKIPFQTFCAYNNEIDNLNRIEDILFRFLGSKYKFDLIIDVEKKLYRIIIEKIFSSLQIVLNFSFDQMGLIVSLYHEQNYYPNYTI